MPVTESLYCRWWVNEGTTKALGEKHLPVPAQTLLSPTSVWKTQYFWLWDCAKPIWGYHSGAKSSWIWRVYCWWTTRPGRFTPGGGEDSDTHWTGCWVGPLRRSGHFSAEKNQERKLNSFDRTYGASRCSPVSVVTKLVACRPKCLGSIARREEFSSPGTRCVSAVRDRR